MSMPNPSGDLARPRRQGLEALRDPHGPGAEDARIHVLQLRADARPKAHMGEDILLEASARRDLGQRYAAVLQLEHGALGDVADVLAPLRGERGAEADLADLRHEFAEGAIAPDRETAILDGDVELAAGHGAAEDQSFGVLRDVDEAARAVPALAEAGDVDIAGFVHLREGEKGAGQPAAVVEVELIGLVQDDARIDRSAELAG